MAPGSVPPPRYLMRVGAQIYSEVVDVALIDYLAQTTSDSMVIDLVGEKP